MPSRAELELRARAVNVDPASYANDSKLEQKVIYAEKNTPGDAVKATGVLTSSDVFGNNETVTIGGYVYTFKTSLTASTTAFEVLIGASAAASLDNLKSAINASAGAGTTYGSKTYAHPSVTATTNTDTAQTVEAKNAGAEANAIATTTTCADVAWGALTLENGANGTYYKGETNRSEAQVSGGANV